MANHIISVDDLSVEDVVLNIIKKFNVMKLISNLTVKLGKNSYKILIDKNFPFKIKKNSPKLKSSQKLL